MYKEGEKTPYHQKVLDWHVPRLLEDCRTSSDYNRRRADVDRFNEVCPSHEDQLVGTQFLGSRNTNGGSEAFASYQLSLGRVLTFRWATTRLTSFPQLAFGFVFKGENRLH